VQEIATEDDVLDIAFLGDPEYPIERLEVVLQALDLSFMRINVDVGKNQSVRHLKSSWAE